MYFTFLNAPSANISDGGISIMTATFVSVRFLAEGFVPPLPFGCLFTRRQPHSSCSARRTQDISFSTSKFAFHVFFFLHLTSSWKARY